MTELQRVREAAEYVASQTDLRPAVGLILGSGLGGLADEMEDATAISYPNIPHFPASTVPGHKGQLVVGKLAGTPVYAMQGRFHFYEGYPMEQVVRPVRVMAQLGVKTIVVTNAAGGVNESFTAGDLMLITDHINMFGTNPLIGPNEEEFGLRFPDMTEAYDKQLRALAAASGGGARIDSCSKACTWAFRGRPLKRRRKFAWPACWARTRSACPRFLKSLRPATWACGCWASRASATWPRAFCPSRLTHEDVMKVTARVKETFGTLVKGIVAKL